MQIQLIRHATLMVTLDEMNLLVDPMFSPASAWDPVRETPNPQRNPLVDLPMDAAALQTRIDSTDAVIITHTHGDHWDADAQRILPKSLPIFCQPEDAEKISSAGFTDVRVVAFELDWEGMRISRTGGQHGTGKIGKAMAPVSGFVLRGKGGECVYLAGDTIWCPEVESALETHTPDVVVVNAGAAQFLTGDPITMTAEDVIQVAKAAPRAKIIAVHMEAINHCLLKRPALAEAVKKAGLSPQITIPQDGESLDG